MTKSVLVTGGLSGIGYATINKLLEQYSPENIYTTTRKVDNKSLKLLNELGIDSKNLFSLDLESIESTKSFISVFKKSCNELSGLVLNAAHIEISPALMTTYKSIDEHMMINFKSQILITQKLIQKYFLRQNHGSVVAVSSSAAKFANSGRLAYAASKSALTTAMRIFSRELGSRSIRFNCISPGLTETKLMRRSTNEKAIEPYLENTDLKKIAGANQIAPLILFLLSNESDHITGQDISIDGGI